MIDSDYVCRLRRAAYIASTPVITTLRNQNLVFFQKITSYLINRYIHNKRKRSADPFVGLVSPRPPIPA